MAASSIFHVRRAGSSCALSVRSLSKVFARGPAHSPHRTSALVDVSLDILSGEVLGLVGAAGSGKTTLLQCSAGLLRRDSGFIEWFGEPFPGGGCLPGLAHVPSTPVYYPFLTVRDVLAYRTSRDELPLGGRNDLIGSLLARLELEEISSAYVGDLPREAVKRLALAEALATTPRVIFVDGTFSDVSSACPPAVQRTLREEAASGCTVAVAARDAATVAAIASRIVLLESGKVVGAFSKDSDQRSEMPATTVFPALVSRDRLIAERMH